MMDPIATAATFVVLTLTSLMGAAVGQSPTYVVQPDCSALQPAPCKVIPLLDDDGEVSYADYEESCPNYICSAIKPVFPPVSNTSSMPMSMIRNERPSKDFSRGSTRGQRHHAAERSSAAFTSIADSTEKAAFTIVNNSSAPWFCSVANISYPARVEANTGYPPGKKEDMYAQCQYQQLLDTQSLGDCRHMRFTCAECALYYQYWIVREMNFMPLSLLWWKFNKGVRVHDFNCEILFFQLCAMAFPQCDPDKTVTTYPASNSSTPNSTVPTKIFSILKPCRGICWAVVQRCQQYPNFNCPLSDTRDYGDYPLCNALGLDRGTTPVAKGIYW